MKEEKKESKSTKVKSIGQRDIAKALSLKFGLNISEIESIIEEEQKLTMMYVSRGYKVIKKNYITIKPVVQHPRKFVCPINKKEYNIPKRYRILITAGCGFKSYVNKDKKMPDKMCRFVQ